MSRNNYLTEAFKSMRSDDILNEEAFTLDSKGADELKQFLDGDNMDDTISVIDPDAKTPEELEDSYIGKVILDCCVCHSKLYKDKDDVVIDEDGDLANVDEECPFCYCVDGFKIVGEVKEFNKDDSDDEEKDEKDDNDEKDEVEVKETEEDEKIEESVSAKRSARMKKKVRSLKEGSDGGKYFDKIAKHFYYTDSTDFLDLVGRIVSNIDFSSSDIDAEVLDAVNDGLTYFDDQWEILKEYSETPADANYDSAYNKFLDDMYFLAKEIAEDNDASSDDDEDDGENESLKEGKKLREGEIPQRQFRLETERLLRKAIGSDYISSILDHKVGGNTIFDLVKEDVEETSGWGDEGVYNEDDIKLAIGRVLEDTLGETDESLKEGKKLREAPNYELHPQYDSRKSFYGKARVDTGDKDDKNKLYSYDTLVAEIKDGKPVVYGAFSATTLRHIKDWLKQNGFKAENKAQILRDYGVKSEAKKAVTESGYVSDKFEEELKRILYGKDRKTLQKIADDFESKDENGNAVSSLSSKKIVDTMVDFMVNTMNKDEILEVMDAYGVHRSDFSEDALSESKKCESKEILTLDDVNMDTKLEPDGSRSDSPLRSCKTVGDFLQELGGGMDDESSIEVSTLDELNRYLKKYGFKPIGVKNESKKCRKHDIKRIEEGWRGSDEIEVVSHGEWADPDLVYKDYTFNYWDIEDALWDNFLEETGHKDSESEDPKVEAEFDKYVQDNAVGYLEDCIAFGYFPKGKKSWRKDECKESVTESVEEVSVKTDKEDISVRTGEDGKVSVETSVREETDEGAEEIAPVSDEVKAEIEDDSEEAEIGDEIDVEMTDFDEESFDELGEAYLKKAYSNVESYKSVSATANDNRITVEGVIKFKSGNEKKTKFVLESKEVTKSGKSRFVGENLQIAKGKKAFTVFGTLSEGRFVTESLGYDYRAKDKNGKSKRISGTVTKR